MVEDKNKLILDSFTSLFKDLNKEDNNYNEIIIEILLEELLKANFNAKAEESKCQN